MEHARAQALDSALSRRSCRRIRGIVWVSLLLAVATASLADSHYDVDPDTGYRMERYRAPVPEDFPDGTTLDTAGARALLASDDAVFIDVYPPRGLGTDPLDGTWLINETHDTIPGATWLPEVGRGFLEDGHKAYLRRNLERLTGGDVSTPLVFFCTSDCWQSWNASRRVFRMGYTAVHWYPLGTDGWQEEGNPVVRAYPLNFLDDSLPEEAFVSTLPETAAIYLVDQSDQELRIGTVSFGEIVTIDDKARRRVGVEMIGNSFNDHFLSMRPFRCIEHPSEWYCYLPYPYEIEATVAANDFTDLEYQLLFIRKRSSEFGIDAWNGLYYKLEAQASGEIRGRVFEGDLNILAEPPEPDSRPIDLAEFIDDSADERHFPTLIIRP